MMKNANNSKSRPSLYGFHAVEQAWLNPNREVKALLITEAALKGFEIQIKQAQKQRLNRPQPTLMDKQKLENLLPKGAVHQGIALDCALLPEIDLQDLIIRSHNKKTARIAILDQVTDPHNVGAILRSASAFGLDGVLMQKKFAPTLDGVLAKTACGAVDHIPVAQATNLARALDDLKEAGFFILGLSEHAPQSLEQINPPEKCAIILGSEGEGMRRLLMENCDSLVRLPTDGAIASLNVSNAAAVCFYALKGDNYMHKTS